MIVLLALASTACAIEGERSDDREPAPTVGLAITKEDNVSDRCASCVLDGDECLLVSDDLSDWGKGPYPSSRERFCDADCCR